MKLVSAEELREAWGMSNATFWRMEKSGKLKPLRIGGRKYYRLSDVKAFMKAASDAKPFPVPWSDQVTAPESSPAEPSVAEGPHVDTAA